MEIVLSVLMISLIVGLIAAKRRHDRISLAALEYQRALAEVELIASRYIGVLHECTGQINTTYDPETYLGNYDLLLGTMNELIRIEHLVSFGWGTPSTQLQIFLEKRKTMDVQFVRRSFGQLLNELSEMSSIERKSNKKNAYIANMMPYIERMSQEARSVFYVMEESLHEILVREYQMAEESRIHVPY